MENALSIDTETYGKHENSLKAEFRSATVLEMIRMHHMTFRLLSELAFSYTHVLQAV
jgi:hypothetical protein